MYGYGCGPRGRHALWPMMAMMGGRHRHWRGGFGGGHDGSDLGGYGRRNRSRMFGSGELRLVLLALIAEVPRHGYELIKAILELTGENYAPSPGVVYPTLNLLTDEGLIEEQVDQGLRKAYRATTAGLKEMNERADEANDLIERLKSVGEEQRASPVRQVQRAMDNVRNALRYQRQRGEISQDAIEQIVDILDEAARKIERL